MKPALDPTGIDLQVPPAPLTAHDQQAIRAAIAAYKHTGQLPEKVQKARAVVHHSAA